MGQHAPERETTLNLPPCCFAEIPTSGEVVLIVRGGEGYHPVSSPFPAAQLNATLPRPPTAAEIEAMLVGSMFGWDVPGAKPACHAAIRTPQESKPTKENARVDADLAGEAAVKRREHLSIMAPSLADEP